MVFNCYSYIKYVTGIWVPTLELIDLYRLYAVISGIFMLLFIGYMYKNREQPRIDYIKQLCDNICC